MKRSISTRQELEEDRVRRLAERRGLRLHRSRSRDPQAYDYGRYMLRDANTRVIVAGTTNTGRAVWTLGDVETFLTGAVTFLEPKNRLASAEVRSLNSGAGPAQAAPDSL
jgi:hypothetical protein